MVQGKNAYLVSVKFRFPSLDNKQITILRLQKLIKFNFENTDGKKMKKMQPSLAFLLSLGD